MQAGGTGAALYEHQIFNGGNIMLAQDKDGNLVGKTIVEYETATEKDGYKRVTMNAEIDAKVIYTGDGYRVIVDIGGKTSELLVK
jgi:hypothetical protein